MIEGYEVYRLYMAAKLHFTTEAYDVFEHKAAVNCPRESYNKRRDCKIFSNIGFKFDSKQKLLTFLVANFAYGVNPLYEIELSKENLNLWTKRKFMLTRLFSEDVDVIFEIMDKDKVSLEEAAFTAFIANKVSIETMALLDSRKNISESWTKSSTWNLLFKDNILRVKKLKPFLKNINVEEIDRIIREKESERVS